MVAQGASVEQIDALMGGERVPRAKRKGPTPEGLVIREVRAYLRHHLKVAWVARINRGSLTIPAGGSYARRHFEFCDMPGMSDFIGQLTDGRFLAVECKARGGHLTQAQADFLRLVERNGGVAICAMSIHDLAVLDSGVVDLRTGWGG